MQDGESEFLFTQSDDYNEASNNHNHSEYTEADDHRFKGYWGGEGLPPAPLSGGE